MSKINKFKSVINSMLSIISSRNFDYKGYWFPGFLAQPHCNYQFNLLGKLPFNQIEKDFVTEIIKIMKIQINLQDLQDYELKSVIFKFWNDEDEIYQSAGRNCKKIKIAINVITTSGRKFNLSKCLYADTHNPNREFKRGI